MNEADGSNLNPESPMPAAGPAGPGSREGIRGLVGNSEAFPILRKWDFYNHAGVSPLPRAATEALHSYATQAATAAYLGWGWHRDIEKLRDGAARLINAHREEIAFVKNTSEGLSIVAKGIDWQWGDRIVTTAIEYPANIYPWMEISRGHGVKLVMVEEEDRGDGSRWVPTEKILAAAAEGRTRMISLSHVEFASGQRHDLARIGNYCRDNGIYFCVDAIQTIGALPVDVRGMCIDFLSADGHKWMLGPEGAGFFFCRREVLEHVRPLMIGWMNVVNAQNYGDYDYTLRPDAGRFECGSYNVPGLLSLRASVDLLLSAGITGISQRIYDLTTDLAAGLRKKGYRVISPRDGEHWSGIVSFHSPKHSHEKLLADLRRDHHIEIALRERRLRCSPHFYNTDAQIGRFIERLPGH